nr:hypothetical protein [uncultured Roseococcus sp.]
MTPTPDDLARWGRILYGERWQADLTEALELRDSSRIREMLSGRRRIPPGLPAKIAAIAATKAGAIQELMRELESFPPPPQAAP